MDDFTGYQQQQLIAEGKATSADAVPGGETDYNNLLFNAGVLLNLTDTQQTGLIFPVALKSRILPNSMVPALMVRRSVVIIRCSTV